MPQRRAGRCVRGASRTGRLIAPKACIRPPWRHDVDVNDEPFDQLMAILDPPVYVVTTQADGQASGCLVSFATQISVRPPRFLVGISKRSKACEAASGPE